MINSAVCKGFSLEMNQVSGVRVHVKASVPILLIAKIFLVNLPHNFITIFDFVEID